MSSLKPRAVLTSDQAIEIFRLSMPTESAKKRPTATSVARQFGVNEKTIRDIWSGRTWDDETLTLDFNRSPKKAKKTGRPLGCKDSVPRKLKTCSRANKSRSIVADSSEIEMRTDGPCTQGPDRLDTSIPHGTERMEDTWKPMSSQPRFLTARPEPANQLLLCSFVPSYFPQGSHLNFAQNSTSNFSIIDSIPERKVADPQFVKKQAHEMPCDCAALLAIPSGAAPSPHRDAPEINIDAFRTLPRLSSPLVVGPPPRLPPTLLPFSAPPEEQHAAPPEAQRFPTPQEAQHCCLGPVPSPSVFPDFVGNQPLSQAPPRQAIDAPASLLALQPALSASFLLLAAAAAASAASRRSAVLPTPFSGPAPPLAAGFLAPFPPQAAPAVAAGLPPWLEGRPGELLPAAPVWGWNMPAAAARSL